MICEVKFGRGARSGKARRGSTLGMCDRGATPPGGMPRPKSAIQIIRTLHQCQDTKVSR